jgi:hypothetical protein
MSGLWSDDLEPRKITYFSDPNFLYGLVSERQINVKDKDLTLKVLTLKVLTLKV